MSGSGRKAIPDVRELSRDTPGSSKVVGGLPDVRDWSGEPPGCLGAVGRTSWISGSGREACRMSWSGQLAIANV